MLTLSTRDLDRLAVLHQVSDGLISVAAGAQRVRVVVRHFRRMLRRFEEEGDRSVIHRGRDQPSNRRLPEAVRRVALERAREPRYHDFGPTLLAECPVTPSFTQLGDTKIYAAISSGIRDSSGGSELGYASLAAP